MLLVKSLDDGSVYFEGYANKSIVDRGGDLIDKKAWKLENYKKNPIILFNHDHSKPIGKMVKVEANDEGLLVKGRISNSKDPEISRIRDLVKEGILNSLSVGMRVSDEERKGEVNHIKNCELHEVSVVAVPMNQDSQFTATAKSMNGSLTHVLATVSEQTGHSDVAKAYEKIDSDEFVTIEQASERLAELAKVAKDVAYKFLKLECDETPLELKQWITKADESEEEQEPKENVLAIKVPKSEFASTEELEAWATESGWKSDNVQETEEYYLLVQNEFEGETREVDLGDGVLAILAKDDGEGDSETEDLRMQFESETAQAVSGEDGNPPSWVTDEEAWAKAKEMSQAALGEISYAFVTWAYHKLVSGKSMDKDKGLLDDANPMTQPLDGKPNLPVEVNPGLDQAKQTNVLLSNIVSLLQQLVDKTGSVQVTEQPKVEVETETETETEEESVKMISEWFTGINSRLKNLGL